MPYNIQSGGNGVNPAAGSFKEMTINSLTVKAADPNAHYHHYVSKVTKEATCTEEGQITYTCTATNGTCDKKTYTEVIPKKAHSYGDWIVVKAATETETGLKSHTCTVCGYNETAVIPATGKDTPVTPDTPVSGDAKVHNFTESGTTSDFYTITGNIATNKGTATYNGLTLTKCLKMEKTTSIKFTAPSAGKLTLVFGGTVSGKNVNVNGTSKTVGSDGTLTVDVAAGSVEITKKDAINLFYMVYTPSGTTHTHKYESKITKQATCTEAGVLTYTCTSTTGTCDKKTYTETIPAKGHSFSTEWTVDVEATETTAGSKSHHCTVCDAKTDVTVIPATGTDDSKYDAKYYAPVFDAEYYIATYDDVKELVGADAKKALTHFVEQGMAEGRQGIADFDVNTYKIRYADLRDVYGDNLVSYYIHYIEYGKAEGRSGKPSKTTIYEGVDYSSVFDPEYYLAKYPDLRAAFGEDETKAIAHFVEYGMPEGRQGSAEFNAVLYQLRNADLNEAFGENMKLYYMHYLNYGKAEGRNASREKDHLVIFRKDGKVVKVQEVSDGESAEAPEDIEAEKNFKCWDADYTNVTTDVEVNAVYGEDNGMTYYAAVFDAKYYLSKYADIKEAFGNDEEKAFAHFVEYGMAEGRQGIATFDVKAYRARYTDLNAVYGDNLKSYFIHYIDYGQAEGRDGSPEV